MRILVLFGGVALTALAHAQTLPTPQPAPATPTLPRLQTCNGVTTLQQEPASAPSMSSVPSMPCNTPPPASLPPPPRTAQPTMNPIGGVTPQTANPNPTIGGVPTSSP